VETFIVQRNVDLATAGEDFSLVLVALAGATTPEEFLAHLSLKFNVSVGAAKGYECQRGGLSCIAMQGGKMQAQAGLQVPEPAVDSCSEVQRQDFDPMLVEVEAGLTSQVGGSPPTVRTDLLGADEGCPIGDDATTTMHSNVVEFESQGPSDGLSAAVDSSAIGMPAAAGAAASAATVQEELEALVCLPLQTPLLERLRLRRSRTPVSIHSLRRSGHIAARPWATNATRQVQNVLLRKLGIDAEEDAVDSEVKSKFRAAFHHMSAKK
jgi:hypothetical protein